ncbi:hypothetical protein [Inquilinus limosus]|uniref:Uncharacterized protein n=1 Tax=Inquilinus limosus TaxID=171674 RepID=A0A211ZUY8_9PROT|nr:hypothetical protein [Inquilinus limosus]OWJ68976.1 hypothetical protein BWR60_00020 [Inquilinus limosus]
MVDADIRTETAPAAPPDQTDEAILSGLIQLSAAMARAFQAEAIAALQADDLDRAGKAEARFSRLFLGIRRAIALQAKLRQQREAARIAADQDRDDQVAQAADRRRRVAQGVTGAIAAATPTPADTETRERLTVDLWDRLAGDHAGRLDTADRALPIEALIRSLCRALGIPPDRTAIAAAVAGTAEAPGTDTGPARRPEAEDRWRDADEAVATPPPWPAPSDPGGTSPPDPRRPPMAARSPPKSPGQD